MSILIGFLCALISGFLIAVPSSRKQPNLFLAAFLGLTAIELTVWLWGENQSWNWQVNLWHALGYLQMPAFFFFFVSSCYSDFRLKNHDLFHLIPFGLAFIINAPGMPSLGIMSDLFASDTRAAWFFSQLIYFAYIAAIATLLWRFRTQFHLHYAGGRSEVLTWLTHLLVASLFARIIILARGLLSMSSVETYAIFLQMFGALLALAITSWIAMKSLLSPELFREVDRRLLDLATPPRQPANADINRLLEHIETNKPYLNADLTLASLSEQVALTPRELSELLNQSLGVHFFDFINGHRISHAQALLTEHPKRSILQILHECGFNSKSSFNTAFKKHVGMTPSAYRLEAKN